MSRSNPRGIFGVQSVTPYNRLTGLFYGMLEVLDSSSVSLQAEQVDLYGGSNKYPVASEDGQISSEMSLKIGEMPDFAFELFLGKAPTATTAETAGNVGAGTNKNGTSMIAATGILTPIVIPTTGPANLKFGKYVGKATGAAAFDLYISNDIDLTRGTDTSLSTDDNKVASVTGVATGANSDVAALGLRFTGGASATAFVTGDTFVFEVRPINAKASVVTIGGSADVFPEFGCIIMAQKRSNDELFEVDAFRCKASGMPLGFESFQWSKPEVKAKLLYDRTQNGIFKSRAIAQE